MAFYEVIPVVGRMVGGHYAIKMPDGKTWGETLGFDKTRANIVAHALRDANKLGQEEVKRELANG